MGVEQKWVYPFPDKKDGCLFCEPSNGGVTAHFASWSGWEKRKKIGNLAEIVLCQTDNLRVIADSLPVREDGMHVLIVRNAHRTAFAQQEDVGAEVAYLLGRMQDETKRQWIFAEHGGGMPHNGHEELSKNQSVWHAHGHGIPLDNDGRDPIAHMGDELRSEGWNPIEVPVLDNNPVATIQRLYEGDPYFIFCVGPTALWISDKKGAMKSMLTQRKMSKFFGGEELRWKDIPTNPKLGEIATRRLMNLMSYCNGSGLFTAR